MKYRVMIVDDDPDIRFVLRGLLRPAFEVVEAENGLDALEKVERYEPDLMLLDVNMPIMNGFRCCDGVRRHPQFGDMPVFFFSGYGDSETQQTAFASGATAYLEKPINTRQLIELLENHFKSAQRPPREKTFSLDELAQIDSAPLRGEDDISNLPTPRPTEAGFPPLPPAEPETLVEATESAKPEPMVELAPEERPATRAAAPPESPGGKKRRVFGRGSAGAAQPAAAAEREAAQEAAPPLTAAPPEAPPAAPPSEGKKEAAPAVPEPQAPAAARPAAAPPEAPACPPTPRPAYGRVTRRRPVAGPGALRSLISGEKAAQEAAAPPPPAPAPASPAPPAPIPAATAAPPPPADETRPPFALPADLSETARRLLRSHRKAAPALEPAAPAAPRPAPSPPPPSSAGLAPGAAQPRIMVIHNNPRDLVTLAEGIKGKGEFMPLEDPVEAIEHIARFQPDIIICPISMPGWDGAQMAQMLRSNARLAHIAVLFLTHAQEDPARRALAGRLSGQPLLTQPLDAGQVANAVDRVRTAPGFAVRKKRASYGEFVRDVLQKIQREKESRRRAREQEAHIQHLAGWMQFVSSELRDSAAAGQAPAPGLSARNYYLS